MLIGYFQAFNVEEMQHKINDDGTKIGKFDFKYVDWNQEIFKPKTLYVVSVINPITNKLENEVKFLGKIEKPDNETQFLIYEVK